MTQQTGLPSWSRVQTSKEPVAITGMIRPVSGVGDGCEVDAGAGVGVACSRSSIREVSSLSPVVGCAGVGGGVAVLAGVFAGGTFDPGVAWVVVGAPAVPAGAVVADTESSIREVSPLSPVVGCSGVVGGVAVLAGVFACGTFEPGVAWGVVGALAVPAGAVVAGTESSPPRHPARVRRMRVLARLTHANLYNHACKTPGNR